MRQTLNNELPPQLRVHFLHYDVKAKKKQKKRFPYDLFEHVKGFLAQTGHFSCVPCFRLHKHKFDPKSREIKNLSFVNI